jgi:hypothetical protein
MPAPRRFDVDELLNRPGTYFNPETEIVLVVDDSAAVESELFSDDAADDDAEWVLVSDETPIDEHQRDALLERLQARLTEMPDAEADDLGDDEDELEPDPDPDEL